MDKIARWEVIHEESNSNILVIRDVGPWESFPTITNSAEEVVKYLMKAEMLYDNRRLFYYDSDGRKDEIVYEPVSGAIGFRPAPRGGSRIKDILIEE